MSVCRQLAVGVLIGCLVAVEARAADQGAETAGTGVAPRVAQIPSKPRVAVDWPAPHPLGRGWEDVFISPKETFTYAGVTVRWQIPDATKTESDVLGWLSFHGPSGSLERVDVPAFLSGVRRGEVSVEFETAAYLDEVAFIAIKSPWRRSTASLSEYYASGLTFRVGKQPRQRTIPAGHQSLVQYVSILCPVSLNEWEFRVSDRPTKDLAGELLNQLEIRNLKTGEAHSMSLVRSIRNTFGRFYVEVAAFEPTSHTAALRISASVDETVRGRDAWCYQVVEYHQETAEEFLNRLAEIYGFEVEWLPFPPEGHPESVEYGKRLRSGSPLTISGEYVRYWLGNERRPDKGILNDLAFYWTSPTHVQVRAEGYGQILQERAEEAKRKSTHLRLTALFNKEFTPETKVYQLQRISAASARELAEAELSTFYACPDPLETFIDHLPECARKVEKFHEGGTIGSCNNRALNALSQEAFRKFIAERATKVAVESVVGDERANAIIVTAVPKTHDRIQELLAKMEGLLGKETAAGEVDRYRLEVVLLSGGRAGVVEGRSETPLFFRMDGIVDDVLVEDGKKVESGDVVAALASDEFELTLRETRAEIEGLEAQHAPLTDTYQQTKQLVEHGHAPMIELKKAEVALASWEAKMKRATIQLEKAKRNLEKSVLRAPADGIIVRLAVQPGQKVEAGETIARLRAGSDAGASEDPRAPVADSHPPMTQRAKEAKELMERYGISAQDLEMFGLDTVEQIGRGIVTLAGERGEAGRVKVSLTDNYGCELEFQDVRQPYVIVRGRLLSEDRERPLLENTLYLEKDKPSLLGVTNLREALILVVRLHDVM